MNRVFWGTIVAFLCLGGFLVIEALNSGTSAVLTVSELVSSADNTARKRIRVGARVANAPVQYQVEPQIDLRFQIEDSAHPGNTIPVVYGSLKPDMFAPGRDVIIDGDFINGTLHAKQLLTQCPSKYEPPEPDDTSRYSDSIK